MIDIQCLNEQNDKLNELIKKLKEEKSLFDTKIVTLENDIDHYQNKIREYEDFIDELKVQLEDALEENITLQTEFQTYKLNTGDQLIRKDEELRDIKNDITNKEKIIQRLSKPTERFNIQKMKQKFMKDKKLISSQRRHTIEEKQGDLQIQDFEKIIINYIKESDNDNITNTNNKDNVGKNKDLNVIVEDVPYKRGLVTCRTSQKNINLDNKNSTYNSNMSNNSNTKNNNNNTCLFNKSQRNIPKIINFNSENEKESSEDTTKMNGLNAMIKKQFGDLVICKENKMYLNPLVHKMFNKEQVKEITIALQNMLIRIKQRKNHLANCKKDFIQKLSLRFK